MQGRTIARPVRLGARVTGTVALLTASVFLAIPNESHADGGGFLIDPASGVTGSLAIQGTVYASISDGAGGFYIAGQIASVNGQARTNAAHILADGTVDGWNPAPDNVVLALAKAGSTVYLGGAFSKVSGVPRVRLAAVDAQTGALRPWAPSADAQVQAIAQVGSRVFVGGGFNVVNGVSRSFLAALDASTGTLIPLAGGPDREVYALAARDTELFVGGEFLHMNNVIMGHLASISPTTGTLTRSLPQPNQYVWTLAVDGNDLYLAGGFTGLGTSSRIGLASIDLTTNAVTAWDPGNGGATGIAVSGNSVYLAAGGLAGGANRIGVCRVDRYTARALPMAPAFSTMNVMTVVAGSQWVFLGGSNGAQPTLPAWSNPLVARLPQFGGPVYSTLFVGDTLFVGGSFGRLGSLEPSIPPYVSRQGIAAIRWSTGEILDWNCPVSGPVNAMIAYGNKLIVGGGFTSVAGSTHKRIAVIDRSTGEVDPWDPGLDESVADMKVSNNVLYVGGGFAHAMNQTRSAACAFSLPDLSLTPWDPNVYLGPVNAIECVADHVYLGGKISSVHGVERFALAEVDTSTGAPTSWKPIIGGTVYSIVLHQGMLFITGFLSPVDGNGRGSGAAYLLPSHQLLPWDPGANNTILTMRPYLSGMLLGGEFTVLSGHPQTRIGWVDLASGASLQPVGVVPSGPVEALETRDALLMIGGSFNIINGFADQGWFAVASAPFAPTAVPMSPTRTFRIEVRSTSGLAVPEIRWSTMDSGPGALEIDDVTGRRVIGVRFGSLEAGEHAYRPLIDVQPGIYFARIQSRNETRSAKFVVLR
jgi:hypothetical protein